MYKKKKKLSSWLLKKEKKEKELGNRVLKDNKYSGQNEIQTVNINMLK